MLCVFGWSLRLQNAYRLDTDTTKPTLLLRVGSGKIVPRGLAYSHWAEQMDLSVASQRRRPGLRWGFDFTLLWSELVAGSHMTLSTTFL